MAADTFSKIWDKLEKATATAPDSGFLSQRILPDSVFDISLALKRPYNKRAVLITIKKQNIINLGNYPQVKGFSINQTVFSEDKRDHVTLELILEDQKYTGIYSSLVEDIIGNCTKESTEREMVQSLFKRLQMWRHFLEHYGSEGLNEIQQRGLYGELRFLRDFLIPSLGVTNAIMSWRGPQKAQHDFQVSGIAFEVKTGSEKQPQKIKVSSEQQLDDRGFNALFLNYISIKELVGSGETLPDIIQDIKSQCLDNPSALVEFENLLILAGYLDLHQEKYSQKGYTIRSSYIFKIKEGFPRIIEKDLKTGVGNVEYTIDLSACLSHIIDTNDFRNVLVGIKNGC